MTSPNTPPTPYAPLLAIQTLLAQTDVPERTRMSRVLVRVNKWRQTLLINTYRAKHGNTVFGGPFAGMTYMGATEGALLPRLVGCYEAELHPTLLQMRQENYRHIVDIGCAEGYYAVGLARLMPQCTVFAHDISEVAQKACKELAQLNGVSDRVQVSGIFDGSLLAEHVREKTLVICDTEGAEEHILDPVQFPAFANVDLIVEVHECFKQGLIATLTDRFKATHDIEWVWQSLSATRELPDWVRDLQHLDQILCSWEWRVGATPWAIMRSRTRAVPPEAKPAANKTTNA